MAKMLDVMDALSTVIALDSKDYATTSRDAWVYGIVVGWDGLSMAALANKFGWSPETVANLRSYRKAFRTCWRVRKPLRETQNKHLELSKAVLSYFSHQLSAVECQITLEKMLKLAKEAVHEDGE
jgi:hypothetical protein